MFLTHIGQDCYESAALAGGEGGSGAAEVDLSTVIADSIPVDQRETPSEVRPEVDDAEEKELAALEQDIRTKNPAMRGNIAIHRHQAVLTRTRNQHSKAAEEWTAKEKAWAEREAKIKEQEAEWQQYEWAKDPEILDGLKALALAESNQDKFIELLLQDERYAQRLQKRGAVEQPIVAGDRPKPNKKTEDGTLEYYDDEGVNSLLDWHGAGLEKKLTEKLMKQIGEEMEKKYGGVAKAYEASTTWNTELANSKVTLDRYRNEWRGFKEYEKDIKALLVANDAAREKDHRVPLLSIEEAYIKTVPDKFQEAGKVNEEAMRKKILEEMKKKPAAVAALRPGSGVERGAEEGERDLADVIRANMPRE